MITIKDLNKLIESTGFLPLYRNKPDYFKKVHAFWSKKAARKNAAQYNIDKRDGWARVIKDWEKFNSKSPAMYPSIYMGCAWVAPLDTIIDGVEYSVVDIYEPKRTDDSKTHWGWGITNDNGEFEQTWPTLTCRINSKKYETVEEFLAELPSLLEQLKNSDQLKHKCESSYSKYYTPEQLILRCGQDGSNT